MPTGVYKRKKGLKRKPLSERHKRQIRKAVKGRKSPMKGKKQTEYFKYVQKGRWKGEKNPNWKGGISPLVEKIRKCFKYRQWRSDVFTRDNFTCQKCGARGVYLEAHHCPKSFAEILKEYNIKTFEEAMECEELWNINGGTTLCKKCHNLTKSQKENFRRHNQA